MEIRFRNKKLRELIQNSKKLIKKYGQPMARKITQRHEELKAADTLADMPPAAGTHPLIDNRKGQYGIYLKHPYRLVIIPIGTFDPIKIGSIEEIEIKEIIDYH